MSDDEIAEARGILARLQTSLTPTREDFPQAMQALAELLTAYAKGPITPQAATTKAALYLKHVSDLPGWAIERAVRAWLRAEAGDYDYHWQPEVPEFRIIVQQQTAALRFEATKLERLLEAAGKGTEAKPSDAERARVIDGFQKLSDALGGAPQAIPHETASAIGDLGLE